MTGVIAPRDCGAGSAKRPSHSASVERGDPAHPEEEKQDPDDATGDLGRRSG